MIKKSKKLSEERYIEAVGRRKTAIARVRLFSATKNSVVINGRPLEIYFPTLELKQVALAPLAARPEATPVEIKIKVIGSGLSSQAGAVSHGLARALCLQDGGLRSGLKKLLLLRRDSRMKERRKFGLKKARKAPQWSKR